jgi:hypothetical protein
MFPLYESLLRSDVSVVRDTDIIKAEIAADKIDGGERCVRG